jgi:hypothetical protein
MANEITLTAKLVAKKGAGYATSFPDTQTTQVDMAGDNLGNNTQTIGTTAEAITMGDINTGGNTLGWFIVWNRDPTNYVQISYGDATGTNFADKIIGRIPPGKHAGPLLAEGNIIYAKANTASCSVGWAAAQL